MFNMILSYFKKPAPKEKIAPVLEKTAKQIADENNEPYVNIISMEIDPANIGSGSFELDWNDKFIVKLVKAGYVGKTDQNLVDQWFTDLCRNIVLETFEQDMADPDKRNNFGN